jgi:anion-transporting  ArsA/GET3 family ATPase
VIGGFGERTRGVAALLRAPETSFLIVTSPEPEPVSEAAFLAERLGAAEMPLGEVIVNRVHLDGLGGHSPEHVSQLLAAELGGALAGRVASNLADFDVLAHRDRAAIAQLGALLEGGRPIVVPQLDEDVQDLLGLARIAEYLFQ